MRLLDTALDLLYPPRCAFCRRMVRDSRMLCPACEKTLPVPPEEEQVRMFPELDLCVSALYYTGDVRESIHRYKFSGAAAYAGIYGELMAACMARHGMSPDCLTWVPLSRQRLRKRGYDQARLLAEEVGARTGIPCLRLIRKIRNNPAQSGTGDAEARKRNVKGVYEASSEAAGKYILLIDDIVTTGATLSEAARALTAAGAAEVSALTLARTERN